MGSVGHAEALPLLNEALELRQRWTAAPTPHAPLSADAAKRLRWEPVDGIVRAAGDGAEYDDAALFDGRSIADFTEGVGRLFAIRSNGPVVSYAYQRLRLLEAQYNVHVMLNGEAEMDEMMATPHRDFYNVSPPAPPSAPHPWPAARPCIPAPEPAPLAGAKGRHARAP